MDDNHFFYVLGCNVLPWLLTSHMLAFCWSLLRGLVRHKYCSLSLLNARQYPLAAHYWIFCSPVPQLLYSLCLLLEKYDIKAVWIIILSFFLLMSERPSPKQGLHSGLYLADYLISIANPTSTGE